MLKGGDRTVGIGEGSLEMGEYVVWADETTARTTVTVSEGAVTELFLI